MIVVQLLTKSLDMYIHGSSVAHILEIRTASDPAELDQDWIDWAEKKADWFDPNVARDDEFFGKRRHEDDPERKKLECKW